MTTNKVTRKQAEAVLALVEKKFASYLKTFATSPGGEIDFDTMVDVPESDRPHIVESFGDTGQTAIVWESGAPYEWAYSPLADVYVDEEVATVLRDEFKAADPARLASSDGVEDIKGVATEPYYSYVLLLYPEEG
jgi:hypothetical protein